MSLSKKLNTKPVELREVGRIETFEGANGVIEINTWTAGIGYQQAFVKNRKSSGKWYAEIESSSNRNMPAVVSESHDFIRWPPSGGGKGFSIFNNNIYYRDDTSVRGATVSFPLTTPRRAMFAVDFDNGFFWIGINGLWYPSIEGGTHVQTEYFPTRGPLPSDTYRLVLSPERNQSDKYIPRHEAAYPIPNGFSYWE